MRSYSNYRKLVIGVLFLAVGFLCGCSDSPTNNNEETNLPPNAPSGPAPAIGDTAISRLPLMSWSCTDPDSENIQFRLFIKTVDSNFSDANIVNGAVGFINPYFQLTTALEFGTKYYWKINATDDHSNTTSSPAWSFTTISYDSNFVSIPDSSFRRLVVSHLQDISEGDSIYVSMVDTITALNTWNGNYDIHSITGIEHFVSLTDLQIFEMPLTDISPLSSLTNLEELKLSDNQITNISPLTSLVNLEELHISSNQIGSLTPLAGLTNLHLLEIDSTGISSISALSSLTKLTILNIGDNNITDISVVANMTLLQYLFANDNLIVDITPIQNLSNLVSLSLPNNQIDSIPSLVNITGITAFSASHNVITDLSGISEMIWLNQISVTNNQIVDLTPLQNLINLTSISASHNLIVDILPLINNTGLGTGDQCFLEVNPLSDSSKTVHIPTLQARGVTVLYTE